MVSTADVRYGVEASSDDIENFILIIRLVGLRIVASLS